MSGEVPGSAAAISFAARAELYARAVIGGQVVAGKWVKASCQRHLDDLERSERDPLWQFRFDPYKAGRPCHFLEALPHTKGEWAKLQIVNGALVRPRIRLEDWQVFFVAVTFGWVHRETGLRRFRRVYLEVARKNAKSTLAAGLALYLLTADGEAGAEVYSAATKREQARIVWNDAAEMVRLESEFRAMPPHGLGVACTQRAIYQRHTNSKYEPLGRDSESTDGLNTHAFISDELHAQKDRGLYDVLDSSTGARSQPLGIGITTSGYDQTGVCYEQRTYLIRILKTTLERHGGMGYRVEGDDAIEDETFFGLIFTLDTGYADGRPDDLWTDEAVWPKANPNLHVSVSIDDMRAKCAKAKASSLSQPEFRTKHCCQWLAADSVWMDLDRWDECADRGLDEATFAGESCWDGLDAAFKTDIFAKVKLYRRDGEYYAFGRYWMPELQLDPVQRPKLYAWAQEGLIASSPGAVVDIELVRQALREDRDAGELREVTFDPAMLTQFAAELLEEGFPMVEIRPTFNRFSEPMKKLEELVLQGKFHHNGDPVLRWMVGNVVCKHKAGLIYPAKPPGQERERKIDGVIALLMALGRAIVDGGDDGIEQGFVVI